VFSPSRESLPDERTRVGIVMAGPRDAWLARPDDVDFYDLKGVVEELVEQATGEAPRFHREGALPAWAHPRAAAAVSVGGEDIGHVAALHPDVVERMDLGRGAVVAELSLDALSRLLRAPQAKAPSRHPAARRDVSLQLSTAHRAGDVAEALREASGALCQSVTIFDRYAKDPASGEHALTFTLVFRADDRTLQDTEVDAAVQRAVDAVSARFGAARR